MRTLIAAAVMAAMLIYGSYPFSCEVDNTLAHTKYFGIAYPNKTRYMSKHGHCLSLCSFEDTCAALYYDKIKQLCHTTTIPTVFEDVCGFGDEVKHALVKQAKVSQLTKMTLNDKTAHRKPVVGKDLESYGVEYPLSYMVEGYTGSTMSFISKLLNGDLTNYSFYINLVSSSMVVGFSVYPCKRFNNDPLNHIVMSVSTTHDQTGNVCTALTEPATPNTWNCYRCTAGHVIGKDLPTQVYYSYGKYVHFTFTQAASLDRLCISELDVLSFNW